MANQFLDDDEEQRAADPADPEVATDLPAAPTEPAKPDAPVDPLADVRARALKALMDAKGPVHTKSTRQDDLDKATQALYHAGTRTALPDSFFKSEDPNADALKNASFEVQRGKAVAALLGKNGGTPEGRPPLIDVMKALYPDEFAKAGPGIEKISGKDAPKVLTALGGYKKTGDQAAEHTHDDETKAEKYATEQEHRKALEDSAKYAAWLPDDHPLLQGGKVTRAQLAEMPLPTLKALASTTVANEATNTKETTKAVEKAAPVVAAQTASKQLRAQLDKYGDKMPGIGPLEGRVPESLLTPALAIGSALGRSSDAPEAPDEARKTRQLMGQLVTEIEQAKGGARAVSNQQSQSRLSEAYGLVKTGTPANLRQALDILDAVKAEEVKSIKTAHPRGAAAVDSLSTDVPVKEPANPTEHPVAPPGKKLQYNRHTGQYRLVDEVP